LLIALISTTIKEISDTVSIEDAIINDRALYVAIPYHLLPSDIKEVATTPCSSSYLKYMVSYSTFLFNLQFIFSFKQAEENSRPITRHFKQARHSAMSGAFTSVAASGVNPNFLNLSTSAPEIAQGKKERKA
jgi:hypothetical protein